MCNRIYWQERENMHAVTWQNDFFIDQNQNHSSSSVYKTLTICLIQNQASGNCHNTLAGVLFGAWYNKVFEYLLLVWCVLNSLDEGRILFCFALFSVLRLNNSRQTIINIPWLLLEHMYSTNATRHNCCIFYTIGKTMLECVQMWKKKLDWKRFSFYKKKRKLTLTYYNVFSGRWIKNINI